MSSSDIFHEALDLLSCNNSSKHQAWCCKIPVLIKQQTFAFLGILQVYLLELSMCIFLKLKYLNLQKLCLQAVEV